MSVTIEPRLLASQPGNRDWPLSWGIDSSRMRLDRLLRSTQCPPAGKQKLSSVRKTVGVRIYPQPSY